MAEICKKRNNMAIKSINALAEELHRLKLKISAVDRYRKANVDSLLTKYEELRDRVETVELDLERAKERNIEAYMTQEACLILLESMGHISEMVHEPALKMQIADAIMEFAKKVGGPHLDIDGETIVSTIKEITRPENDG